jgi:hypothetical protein
VSFAEQPPSKQWAALKFRGEKLAEVWFKPDGEPLVLRFRVPQGSFQIPGIHQGLTIENLLKAVAIAGEEVESWRHGDGSHPAGDEPDLRLRAPLLPPPPGVPHLDLSVRLKPLPQETSAPQSTSAAWQDLEARWKAVLGLEASLETLRISMEGLRAELEGSLKRMLTPDEKLHALAADVVQWNKAKSRLHYVLPKVREFTHRATWALGTPERKRLDELFKNAAEAPAALPRAEQVLDELDFLRKDRQVLSAQGMAVFQECKKIAADVQAALRRLQANAAARASKKRAATGVRGKSS